MKIIMKIPKRLNGTVKMEVEEARGSECLSRTLSLRRQMAGSAPLDRKPEFHEVEVERLQCRD